MDIMDVDVAWCLNCSKRTNNPRNPYCSEQCRLADTSSSSPSVSVDASTALTSPFSQPFIPTPTKSTSPRSKELPPASRRPPLPTFTPSLFKSPPSPSSSSKQPRDRRAFSFPAIAAEPPIPIRRRDARQSVVLPPFSRKPSIAPATPPVAPAARMASSLAIPPSMRLSKSTGANTPTTEPVFCSTSESSDNEGLKPKIKNRMNGSSTARPSRNTRPPLPTSFGESALDSLKPLGFLSRPKSNRKFNPSPVTAMIASSASSRSREDIISWARAVNVRPGDANTSDDEERGRSRTRREVIEAIAPPSQESIDEHDDPNLGTTPKGRIGSALAGLTIGGFGVGPIVKALTSVTGSNHSSSSKIVPVDKDTRLQAAAAPTETSGVIAIATTIPTTTSQESDSHIFYGGATPTLSTISFSEVVDPASMSSTDNAEHDHVDIITDDQSLSGGSSYYRRGSKRSSISKPSATQAPVPQHATTKQTPLPLRPIATTATAIWNLSNYIRSFSPFALPIPSNNDVAKSNVVAAKGQLSTKTPSDSSTPHVSPRCTPSTEQPKLHFNTSQIRLERPPITAPVPTSRVQSPSESPLQLVRSLPMDIIIPVGGIEANEERMRHREAREILERRSRSRRSRSRDGSRPNRSREGRRRDWSRSHSRPRDDGDKVEGRDVRHGRKWSYDADASESDFDHEREHDSDHGHPDTEPHIEESRGRSMSRGRSRIADDDETGRRGRSRVGKILNAADSEPVSVSLGLNNAVQERDWSPPRRDRSGSGGGAEERGRGRGRAVKD